MNWLSLAVAGGLLAFRLVEVQDQPRPPEGRPGEPRPEGRRPDQPRPPEGRPGEPRHEDKEMAERQERARQQVNRIQEEMENHAKALRELGEKLMRANREMAEAGGAPWQWRSRGAAFQGGPGMPGAGFGFPSRINPPGEQPGANPGGSGLNPDAARRFEQLERRLDEVMKRLEQMSRDKR
ncbi:MAG: hypothetical protein ACKO26_20415 [Planctomycetota bacterium]